MKLALCLAALLAGCVADVDSLDHTEDDEGDLVDPNPDGPSAFATVPGINGSACLASPFNCRFHAGTGQRVEKADGSETWAIAAGVTLRDGNGNPLATETGTSATFNYGQTRALAGKAHALMLGSSNASAAWYPMDSIGDATAFRAHVGNVDAKDPGKGPLACYQIRTSVDAVRAAKKVVKNTTSVNHDDLGDYLPLVRANGQRSVNLVFSVPGFALGGATTDHFLAVQPDGSRTKFQRVTVPTATGVPSISIPLYVKDGAGNNKQQSGIARFLYGYITAADGVKRFGWIAQDAVEPATGCR